LEYEEQIKTLEDELEKEREKVRKVHMELAQRTQELQGTKDQMALSSSNLQEQIKERDTQISKLKRQLATKGNSHQVV